MRFVGDPEDTQKDLRAYYVNCPGCSHCSDIHNPAATDSSNMNDTRALVWHQIETWMDLGDKEEPKAEPVLTFLQD